MKRSNRNHRTYDSTFEIVCLKSHTDGGSDGNRCDQQEHRNANPCVDRLEERGGLKSLPDGHFAVVVSVLGCLSLHHHSSPCDVPGMIWIGFVGIRIDRKERTNLEKTIERLDKMNEIMYGKKNTF